MVTNAKLCLVGRSGAFETLVAKRPTANLMSKSVLASLTGNILLQLVFQWSIFSSVVGKYPTVTPNIEEKEVMCFENTILFLLSTFQYITVAIIFTEGPPYRASMLKNSTYRLKLPC
jgi:cation-transporting ATPase 13A3/4/5